LKQEESAKNMPQKRLLTEFCALSGKILRYANRGVSLPQFMQHISKMLLDFSESDAVNLYIRTDQLYHRCEVTKWPKVLFQLKTCKDSAHCLGSNDLGKLRKGVMEGDFKSSSTLLSKQGSFMTGNHSESVHLIHKDGEKKEQYHINLEGGFRSLLLIPFSVEGKKTGVLELKSKNIDYFIKREVEFYEGVAQTLGSALIDRKAQEALRERVKELTCLYGISQVIQKTDVTLDEILHSIVGLLPPALQYPDKAAAQIIVDRRSYKTKGFKKPDYPHAEEYALRGDIYLARQLVGFVEVVYIKKIEEYEGTVFLEEEHHLINEVARKISLVIGRKKAEQEKQELQEQLIHADRLATIGELSAGVAHELNEPLGNILGFAQLAKKDVKTSGQTIKDLEKIIKATLHAREVVKKLLIFARQLPAQKQRANLNKVVSECLYFLELHCQKEGISLKRLLSPDIPDMVLDSSQIQQVVVNLVVNAIHAMPEGGVIRVITEKHENQVSLIIEDTGVGMSKEIIKQIFIPFFTTKEIGQGTGLGLAVVHGIVANHRGTIEVTSKIEHGSRFEVKLPLNTV
jgi:two-component system NtrC family sensor kinase